MVSNFEIGVWSNFQIDEMMDENIKTYDQKRTINIQNPTINFNAQ